MTDDLGGEGPQLRRSDGVLSNSVQDRAVLYSGEVGKAIVVNATGAILWDALETPRTRDELAGLLERRFPQVSPERARADVDAFVERLLRESVLRPAT